MAECGDGGDRHSFARFHGAMQLVLWLHITFSSIGQHVTSPHLTMGKVMSIVAHIWGGTVLHSGKAWWQEGDGRSHASTARKVENRKWGQWIKPPSPPTVTGKATLLNSLRSCHGTRLRQPNSAGA